MITLRVVIWPSLMLFRDQGMDLETRFNVHTNISDVETASPKPPTVWVKSGQKPSTKIIHIVSQTSVTALKCPWSENVFHIIWKYNVWNTQFQNLSFLWYKLLILQTHKVELFCLQNGVWIAQSICHVTSMHDVSLCVGGSSTPPDLSP